MAFAGESVVPYWGPFFSSVMYGARLLRLSKDGVDPFVSLCCMGLRLERELDRLI
jgi:hypothetical protein